MTPSHGRIMPWIMMMTRWWIGQVLLVVVHDACHSGTFMMFLMHYQFIIICFKGFEMAPYGPFKLLYHSNSAIVAGQNHWQSQGQLERHVSSITLRACILLAKTVSFKLYQMHCIQFRYLVQSWQRQFNQILICISKQLNASYWVCKFIATGN